MNAGAADKRQRGLEGVGRDRGVDVQVAEEDQAVGAAGGSAACHPRLDDVGGQCLARDLTRTHLAAEPAALHAEPVGGTEGCDQDEEGCNSQHDPAHVSS